MARMPPLPALPHHDDDHRAPAVNHAGGIARLMGDNALFVRVLARFRNEYRQAAAGIRDALGNGDTPLALRLVHTLKGAAGMIEAVPLRRATQALEQILRHPGQAGTNDEWQQLARLEQALDRVLLELDAAAAMAPAPDARATAAPPLRAHGAESADAAQRDGNAVQRLTALLADGNGEAVDLVRDAASALTAQLGEQRYGQLADTIEAFDFDGALGLLADWT